MSRAKLVELFIRLIEAEQDRDRAMGRRAAELYLENEAEPSFCLLPGVEIDQDLWQMVAPFLSKAQEEVWRRGEWVEAIDRWDRIEQFILARFKTGVDEHFFSRVREYMHNLLSGGPARSDKFFFEMNRIIDSDEFKQFLGNVSPESDRSPPILAEHAEQDPAGEAAP